MDDQRTVAVILAGGQGSRFWPISRMHRPKQFLSIRNDGESLFQSTARRIEGLVGRDGILVVTNVLHESLIKEHVPHARVVSEPVGRNTAASIGLAAVHLEARFGSEAVMIVLPADHAVREEEKQRAVLSNAVKLAQSTERLVTIGIEPLYPHTGYGYIRRGRKINGIGFEVARFFEKPNYDRALKYVESGDFYWNSGIFVWRVGVIMRAFDEYMPALAEGLRRIAPTINTPAYEDTVREVFEGLESLSIDFGVLEHSRRCAVVPGNGLGWSDVGSWDAWAEHFGKDEDGNLLNGDVLLIDSSKCVVQTHAKRMIAGIGLENLIVIDAGDALLICPQDRVQDVRKVVEELKRRGRTDLI